MAIHLRSQNLDRLQVTSGKVGCICPNARFWCRGRERLLLPEELFLLQGMPVNSEAMAQTSVQFQKLLSGNAWNFFNFATAFISCLAVMPIDWLE